MDPKQSAPLDPKLQEVYDRVMGLAIDHPTPPASEPNQQVPQPSSPAISTPTAPVMQQMPTPATSPAPSQTTSTIATAPAETTPAPSAFPQMSASALDAIDPAPTEEKKKSHTFIGKKNMNMNLKISPTILIIGAVAFLLIYTVVWIKVFNLSVPIINP